MTFKATLAGGAAVGLALSLGVTGAAQAKTVRHHHREAAGPSASERALREEVDTLKAQVQSLEGRLDAQSQAQQQTAAAAQTAQATAQQAQSTAQATQQQVATQEAQIETIPAQVEKDTDHKIAPLLNGWFENTKVGGVIFADMSTINNKANGAVVGSLVGSNGAFNTFGNPQPAQNGFSYDIKRAYITIDHKFNNVFSADITTDFTYDSLTKASQLYIKKAYLQANIYGDALVVRGGSADMPWVPFVENLYGYRFVDHVLIDNYSFGTSADWGVHAFGNLYDHHIGYAFSVVDGQGYKVTPQGTIATAAGVVTTTSGGDVTGVIITPTAGARSHGVDFEGRVNGTWDGFTVAVGGYAGHRGTSWGAPEFNVAERFDVLGAYGNKLFKVGVEYMWANYWNDVGQSNPAATNRSEAVSVFGNVNFYQHFSLFGRWDYVKPKEDTAPSFKSNFFNVGLDYKPLDQIDIALVYKHDSVLNGVLSTSNGAIGTTTSGASGVYDEVGIFTGLKF